MFEYLVLTTVTQSDFLCRNRDFHETDQDQVELYQLFANRASIHPSMPTLFLSRADEGRIKINTQLEGVGINALGFNANDIRKKMPDSSNTEDLPYALRNYKCNGEVERGDCESYKWDTGACDLTQFQTQSRSGWKDHLLIGRAIGVFLIKQLTLALDELNQRDAFASIATAIANISHSQDVDRKNYLSSSLHEVHGSNHVGKNTEFLGGLGRFSPFWKTNAFCRTALLPNQARFDGVSTMSSPGRRHSGGFHTDYEIGHSIKNLPPPKPHESDLLLVYTPESFHNCSSAFHIDYKDFFGIRAQDGWVRTMIPNEVEQEEFSSRVNTPAHVIVLCDSVCTSFDCQSVADVGTDDLTITLNGRKVTQVVNLKLYGEESNCYMLYGEKTFLWPNKERQFHLGIMALEGMLRLSSIIII